MQMMICEVAVKGICSSYREKYNCDDNCNKTICGWTCIPVETKPVSSLENNTVELAQMVVKHILQRVEEGTTTQDDADTLREIFELAGLLPEQR